jgi:hypothetical protein
LTRSRFATSLLLVQVLAGCSSGVKGTYTNAGGQVMLELTSGGKATFSLGGDIKTCTYTADDKAIVLSCGRGEQANFRLNADGSLTAPGFIGVMKKSK